MSAHLPRNSQILVDGLAIEEPGNIISNGELEFFLEDDVLPRRLLYLLPERVVPLPETLVEDEDFFVKLAGPGANTSEEGQQNILRSFVKDEVLCLIDELNRPLCSRQVNCIGSPGGKRTNLNYVED